MFSNMMIKPDTNQESQWLTRIEDFSRSVLKLRRRIQYVELSRLLLALSVLVLFYLQLKQTVSGPWVFMLIAGVLLFVVLLKWHGRLQQQLHNCSTLIVLNKESLARSKRDFSMLPPCPPALAHYFSDQDRDLNLYGPGSLGQLLFNLSTSLGDRRIAEWLSRGSPLAQLEQHQQAIQELAPQLDLRQRLYAHAREPHHSGGYRLEHFQLWSADASHSVLNFALKSLGWLLTIISLCCMMLVVCRFASVWAIAPVILFNLIFIALLGRQFRQAFDRLDLQSEALDNLSQIIDIISCGKYQTSILKKIREALNHSSRRPTLALRQLSVIIHHSRLHLNIIPYLIMQSLLLWDFHIFLKLQRWRSQYAEHVTHWLEATMYFEALSAFANLSHENPHWCFPRLSDDSILKAQQAVHPLLPVDKAVANDILLKPGQVTIITGSNMSGKTTYMRTLGLNLKLAMAAGPVACAAMQFPPSELYLAISANDSLNEGMSYFMNEVLQIKALVEGVEHSQQQPIYLLDELLKGTNEQERNVAIVSIVKKLCMQQAMGLITTHNIELSNHPDLQPVCRNIYFEEEINEHLPGKMSFSYRLKDGVSTQTNALKLLKIIGLPLDG